MKRVSYNQLLESRSPVQIKLAKEIQERVAREKEQAIRHYKAKEARVHLRQVK